MTHYGQGIIKYLVILIYSWRSFLKREIAPETILFASVII